MLSALTSSGSVLSKHKNISDFTFFDSAKPSLTFLAYVFPNAVTPRRLLSDKIKKKDLQFVVSHTRTVIHDQLEDIYGPSL